MDDEKEITKMALIFENGVLHEVVFSSHYDYGTNYVFLIYM
jgi:hypothetical protein